MMKKNRLRDPQVQIDEGALTLVFLEFQLAQVAECLGNEATVEVLSKTTKKMSEHGLEAASTLSLDANGSAILAEALTARGST